MALHGDIKVNDHPIGYWEAVRQGKEPAGTNLYKVAYWYRDETERLFSRENLLVQHNYSDGAIMLNAKVAITVDNDIKAQREGS